MFVLLPFPRAKSIMSSNFGSGSGSAGCEHEEDRTIGTISGKTTITLSPYAPLVTPGTKLEFKLPKLRGGYTDEERASTLNLPPAEQK